MHSGISVRYGKPTRRRRPNLPLVILIIVIILTILLGGGYVVYNKFLYGGLFYEKL